MGVVQAYVIDLPSKDMDIVLGQTWMLEHQAHLRYEKPYGVTFKQRGVMHRLSCVSTTISPKGGRVRQRAAKVF